jgi:hypothetical protein
VPGERVAEGKVFIIEVVICSEYVLECEHGQYAVNVVGLMSVTRNYEL